MVVKGVVVEREQRKPLALGYLREKGRRLVPRSTCSIANKKELPYGSAMGLGKERRWDCKKEKRRDCGSAKVKIRRGMDGKENP